MALTTDRISVLRGRPPVRAGGKKGFRIAHCCLVRSLGYGFGFIPFLRSRPPFGTDSNIRPLQISAEELRNGYLRVLSELYAPGPYFERTEALFLRPTFDVGCVKLRSGYWRHHRLRRLEVEVICLAAAVGLFARLMTGLPSAPLRREYRRRFWRFLKVHCRPGLALLCLFHLAMHYHAHTMAKQMSASEQRLVNTF